MNLGALIQAAHQLSPTRSEIVFVDKGGNESTGDVTSGVPASGTPADGFAEGVAIREKTRRLSVDPRRLVFAPKTGHTCQWQGRSWKVLGVSPLKVGEVVILYRVTVERL